MGGPGKNNHALVEGHTKEFTAFPQALVSLWTTLINRELAPQRSVPLADDARPDGVVAVGY